MSRGGAYVYVPYALRDIVRARAHAHLRSVPPDLTIPFLGLEIPDRF